ncbi:MAG: hypothetical protein RL534_310 [Actinomycetota bacterium]
MPTALIAVSARLIPGFWIHLEDLSTTVIISEYQDIEITAQTQERIKIPQPRLNVWGTNCGTNPTLKTAALTLVKLVVIPIRKAGPKALALSPDSSLTAIAFELIAESNKQLPPISKY